MSAREVNRLRMAELERLALLDQLTGLSNRRHIVFPHWIRHELSEFLTIIVTFGSKKTISQATL